MSFVILLIVALAVVCRGEASPITKVYIDPTPKIASFGETFEIKVKISGAAKLGGFDFCLAYDTTILDGLEVTEGSFLASFGQTYIFKLTLEDDYNATHGRIWVAIALLATPEGATGSGTLATITFKATGLGECVLNLYSLKEESSPFGTILVEVPDKIKLGDNVGNPIDHEVEDGYFGDIMLPRLYVDPSRIVPPPRLTLGENFTVNVSVFNVTDLHSSEFKLSYNTTLLNVTTVVEGDFLSSIGATSFASNINKTEGIVEVNVTLVDPMAGATTPGWPSGGVGTLAKVTFNVTSIGECNLDLYDTTLSDPTATPIKHYAVDGYFSNKAIIHDIAVTNVETTPMNVVYAGKNVTITVNIKNNGTEPETFNVTAYYDNTQIEIKKVTSLPEGALRTLTFEWNTEGVAEGNYTISAEASSVLGETNTANNRFTKEGKLRVLPAEQLPMFPIELVAVVIIVAAVVIIGIIFYRRRSRKGQGVVTKALAQRSTSYIRIQPNVKVFPATSTHNNFMLLT